MTETRRVVVQDADHRIDFTVPTSRTIADVLGAAGISLSEGSVALIDGDQQTDLGATVHDLSDGALLTVVDPTLHPESTRTHQHHATHDARGDVTWWLLSATGVTGLALAATGTLNRTWQPIALAGLALITLAVAARPPVRPAQPHPTRRWTSAAADASRVIGPVLLAVAAALSLIPTGMHGSTQVTVVIAAGTAAGVLLVAQLVLPQPATRAMIGTTARLAMVVAAVWAAVVYLGWTVQAGAALTVGLVPLAIRALPTTLLRLPQGYFVEYRRFLRNPWSVRGRVPDPAGPIDPDWITGQVTQSHAARGSGTFVLAAIGAISLPFAVPGNGVGGLAAAGTAIMLTCYVLTLLLIVRPEASAMVRWSVRASAFVGLAIGARLLLGTINDPWIVALVLVLGGLLAAALIAPLARGFTSLSLSRIGDMVQGLAVVLSMPAAFVAANGVELVRRAVSG